MSYAKISEYYLSRLVASLESESQEWDRVERGGPNEGKWYEYLSPVHTNNDGKTVRFRKGWSSVGAYVNGQLLWELGFFETYNIFSSQTRRMWSGIRKVRKACELRESLAIEEELRNSL